MLNEWIDVYSFLKKLGCDLDKSSPYFKVCPPTKQAGFVVYLDANGHVEDVETQSGDIHFADIRRWQRGKKDPAFPVFNVRALFEVPSPSVIPPGILKIIKKPEANRDGGEGKGRTKTTVITCDNELRTFIKDCHDLWDKEDLKLISRCIKELPSQLLSKLAKAKEKPPGGYEAFTELVRRASRCSAERLRDEIGEVLIRKLLTTGEKDYAKNLFALKKEGKKKGRGREHGREFLYLLTIKDWKNYEPGEDGCPPYHRTFQSWMARTFEEHENQNCKPTGERDGFGLDMARAGDKYDDINAAGIGQIKLFAANKVIPSLKRYGLEGPQIFPAGRTAREMARKALEYVFDRKRKGITWENLTKYEGRNTVAFAYCTNLKDTQDNPLIKFFSGDDSPEAHILYISEEATKTALRAFSGIAEDDSEAEIVIGIIASVDPGNTKVLAARHYPFTRFRDGAVRWQKGCANIPDVILPWIFREEKVVRGALPIHPARAIWLLNSTWRQNGEMVTRKQGSKQVPISRSFSSSDALDFLFEGDNPIRTRTDAGLEVVVERSAHALIMAKLRAILNQNKAGGKLKFNDSHYLHMLPTLYGLLLHNKGINKEDYMDENIFRLGKLFAAADRLHILYSRDVRHGDIPLGLIGNESVSHALQNPQEAFVALGRRLMHPYISWAKRTHEKQEGDSELAKLVGWCLWDITKLCQFLSETNLPTEIDSADKAKLILGYLSYGAKSKTANSDNLEYNDKKEEAAS